MRPALQNFYQSHILRLLVLLLAALGPTLLAAQEHPRSFDEIAAQAASARDVNDAPRAIELYTQAVQLDPKWQDGWWFLGMLQYGTGAYAGASDAFSHFLALKPNAVPATAMRGLCEFETGDYQQSLSDIERALSAGAANDARNEQILRYHEAMLLTKLGRFQDALKSYSYFAEHKLSSPELFVAIGLAGLRIPLVPKEVNADQQPLLTAAGNAALQFMEGDETGAQKSFDELFAQFPNATNLHYLYGYLVYSSDPDAALPEFKKELELVPNNLSALIMVSWSLLMRNRPGEALPFAQEAVEQKPDLAAAQLVLGRSLLDSGDVSGGIEHLELGLKQEPDNLEIHIALAKAYSKSGRSDDARRERTLCLQMTQDSATRLANP